MLIWVKFTICILVILFSGRQVARYGDIIAERTGLGGVWIGLVIVAMLTSLPELFTGVSAVRLVDAPDLTAGDILGANAFNMFNLALLDLVHRDGSLLAVVSRTHRLTGLFSLLLVLLVGASIFLSHNFHIMNLGWVGWYTPLIILLYLVFIRVIYQFERRQPELQEVGLYGKELSLRRIYAYFALAAAFIIGAGIWLPFIGDEIALTYGWEQSFVGSLFLAFSTTLPEISVSFAAMRLGARDMAVANLIGSNLFNLTIISLDDLLYFKGPILAAVSESHLVTAIAVTAMTTVFIAGLSFTPKRFFRLSWWNLAMILLFLLAAYYNFARA
jgi:cation:H+ antiporter